MQNFKLDLGFWFCTLHSICMQDIVSVLRAQVSADPATAALMCAGLSGDQINSPPIGRVSNKLILLVWYFLPLMCAGLSGDQINSPPIGRVSNPLILLVWFFLPLMCAGLSGDQINSPPIGQVIKYTHLIGQIQ